jgi:hypothetical protein
MRLAVEGAFVVANVFAGDESMVVDVEGTREMGRIVELVPDVPPEMGYMPSGARERSTPLLSPKYDWWSTALFTQRMPAQF